MYKEILDKIKPEIDKTISFLDRELAKIRTGRVSVSLVEDVLIDSYGGKSPLKQVAALTTSGPRTIVVQPWDKSVLLNIEKSILSSGLGVNPIVEGESLRLVFPAPTEEYRKNLQKALGEKMEAARVTLRRWREEAWRQINESFRQGKIREDDKFRAKDDLQKMIDEYNKQIEDKGAQKAREIME